MTPTEKLILRHLCARQDYLDRVIPFLKPEYFESNDAKVLYGLIAKFVDKFKRAPQTSIIRIGLDNAPKLTERDAKEAGVGLSEVEAEEILGVEHFDWLVQETEAFCQARGLYVALQDAIGIIHDNEKSNHTIPDILKEALAISFDTNIGHDYFDDAERRWEFYHTKEDRVPLDLNVLNEITRGGLPNKSLNVFLAGTGVGKSAIMCHMAAANLRMSQNVLYITLEMAEERIAERIDANMMGVQIDDLEMMPKVDYLRKMAHLRQTSTGRIIIKEYPTSSAHAGHFKALLQELDRKRGFRPQIIYVDYLSICASSKVKLSSGVGSYSYYKAVAEELRALGVEFGVPVVTGAQFNRKGAGGNDAEMTDVAESWGIPQTADFMMALTQTEEQAKVGQVTGTVVKNRYKRKSDHGPIELGFDSTRMRFYELDTSAKKQLPEPGSAPSEAGFGTSKFRRPGNAFARLKPVTQRPSDDD